MFYNVISGTIQLGFLPYFPYLFTIQLAFLLYFPYLFTFQLTFLPYISSLFPFQLTFLSYFPYLQFQTLRLKKYGKMKCFIASCTRKQVTLHFKRCGLIKYGKMKCFITSCTSKASNVSFQTLRFEKVRGKSTGKWSTCISVRTKSYFGWSVRGNYRKRPWPEVTSDSRVFSCYNSSTKCTIAHHRHGYRMWPKVTWPRSGSLGRVRACATRKLRNIRLSRTFSPEMTL
jgi:hypothetical protein